MDWDKAIADYVHSMQRLTLGSEVEQVKFIHLSKAWWPVADKYDLWKSKNPRYIKVKRLGA